MGKKEIMSLMEEIFYSGTFAGETSSLAAANVVLDKIASGDVCSHIQEVGEFLLDGLEQLISKYELTDFVFTGGHPTWSFILFKDTKLFSSAEVKTLFMQEMFKLGILSLGAHNLSYSHSKSDILYLLSCYEKFFKMLILCIESKCITSHLECDVLVPLFKVR